MRYLDSSPFMEECRAAYRNSAAFKALSAGKPLRNTVAAALPREPGEDREELNVAGPELPAGAVPPPITAQQPEPATPALGIELDPLEIEFQNAQADRAEP